MSYSGKSKKLVTCPYDNAHRVLESRLQMHITKCKQNHLDDDKAVCPFNAQHRIPSAYLSDHLMSCPERYPLDREVSASADENNAFKGRTAVPCYTQPTVSAINECWDNEINVDPLPGYKPNQDPLKGAIVNDLSYLKKAERKKLYNRLATIYNDEDNETENSEKQIEYLKLKELRQPKGQPEAIQQQRKKELQLQNLGLGRGQPSGNRRIAANIFGQQEQNSTMRQPTTIGEAISGLQNQHLIGRGRGLYKPAPSLYEASDFPTLGLGRGSVPVKNDS